MRGFQYHQLAELFQGENGSLVNITLQEGSGDKARLVHVSVNREPQKENVSTTTGRRARRIDTDIDPVAAENAVKNAQVFNQLCVYACGVNIYIYIYIYIYI